MSVILSTSESLEEVSQFHWAPPAWQWHRPLTLSNWDDGLSDQQRNEIYRQGEIALQEISRINLVRYKQVGPAFVPRRPDPPISLRNRIIQTRWYASRFLRRFLRVE